MFKNISSVKLIGILVVLVLVYLGIEFFGSKSRSKSFRSELVEIDTAKVTRMLIDAKGKSLELKKKENNWEVSIGENKYAPAQKSSVEGTFRSLLTIKPSRVVAKSPEKWKDYQVDSTGTRVEVFEGDKKTLDLVIGRFGMQQQRNFYTYVRLFDEDEVYAADNFMGISFNTNPADFRDKQILTITPDSVMEIRYNYPADSGFVLSRADSIWQIGGVQTDSAATAEYMRDIRHLTSSSFVDDVAPSGLGAPFMQVVIKEGNAPKIIVKAWRHPQHYWVINSSQNPETYFSDADIVDKLFVNKDQLLKNTIVGD